MNELGGPSAAPQPRAAASLSRRIASLCYELLLLFAVLFVSSWMFLLIDRALDPALVRPVQQLFLLAITATHFIYCWTHGGQTRPMKTWHIRVVTRVGDSLTCKLAMVRFLLAIAGVAACGMGFAWALVDRDRQFLHDRLAGTRLVKDEGGRRNDE